MDANKLEDDIYRIPKQVCPYCARPLDATGPIPGSDNQAPAPGDVTLCLRCGGLAIYEADLTMRIPMISELLEMKSSPEWPQIEKFRQGIAAVNRKPDV